MPSRSPPPTDLSGADQRLGAYRLVRPISAGGMARVYEARLDSLAGVSTRVAIKVIHPDYAADDSFQDLFIAEARISARLEHQNVVRVQQFNREDGLYFLVMEFIDGVTFRRLISLSRRSRVELTPRIVAELGRQAAEGLHYAHRLADEAGRPFGLVHRDVKPSNLMLNAQGVVKVLDFGISSAHGSDLGGEEGAASVKGTWGYMAPEQAEGQAVGPSADIFGLGAVLYELATGEALFDDKDNNRIREKLAADDAARKAAALGGIWRDLGSLLVRALQRDPSARFPSAAAFSRALSGVVGDQMAAQEAVNDLVTEAMRVEVSAPPPAVLDRPRTASTLQVGSPGALPVAVGDHRGVVRPSVAERPSRRRPPPRNRTSLAILGVLLCALVGTVVLGWLFPPPALRPWLGGRVAEEPVQTSVASPEAAVLAGEGAPVVAGLQATAEPVAVAPASIPAPVQAVEPEPPTAVTAVGAPRSSGDPGSPPTNLGAGPRVATPEAPRPAPAPSAVPPTAAAPPAAPVSPAAAEGTVPDGLGLLTLSSVPQAQAQVDGVYVGYTPYFQGETAVGSHSVVLVTDDGRRKTFRVDVRAGEETRKVWLFDESRWQE